MGFGAVPVTQFAVGLEQAFLEEAERGGRGERVIVTRLDGRARSEPV